MIKAILFDMDGVLIDSELHWERQQTHFLKPLVTRFEKRHSREVQGLSNHSFYEYLKRECGLVPERDEFMLRLREFADNLYRVHVQLMPGVLYLINELRHRKAHLSIVSSSPMRHVQMVADRFGLLEYFTDLVSADMVGGIGKPNPDVYLLAASRAGLTPKECLAIEDSRHGITAAKAAGIPVIALRSDQNPDQDLSEADWEFNGFCQELKQMMLDKLATPENTARQDS